MKLTPKKMLGNLHSKLLTQTLVTQSIMDLLVEKNLFTKEEIQEKIDYNIELWEELVMENKKLLQLTNDVLEKLPDDEPSEEEVFEALAMTSVLGIHSCSLGMPVLIEELQAAGKLNRPKIDERRQKIKDEYIKVRGYWSERQEDMLAMAPEFFEAYLNFSGAPWRTNVLEPKVREFVYIAIDASTTHLYEPGLRLHIRNAIGYGASQEELMEILQLIAALGIHTMTESLPILTQEAAKAKNKKG